MNPFSLGMAADILSSPGVEMTMLFAGFGSQQVSSGAQYKAIGWSNGPLYASVDNTQIFEINNPLSVSTPTDGLLAKCYKNMKRHTSIATGSGYNVRRAYWRNLKKKLTPHFAIGLKINEFVIYDIKFNSKGHNPSEADFPGPKNRKNNKKWRFRLFYSRGAKIAI